MKARDLAALAALGIAGKVAYDKYGNKTPAAKRKMGEGLEMSNQGAYERATIPTSDAEDVALGTKGAYLPEAVERGAYLPAGADYGNEGSRVAKSFTPTAKAAVAKAAVSGALNSQGGPSRYRRAVDANDANSSLESTGGPSRYRPAADSNNASNSFSSTEEGMAGYAPRYTPAIAATPAGQDAMSAYNRAVNPAMQADRMAAAGSPSARMTDALAVRSRANQAAYLAQQRAAQQAEDMLRASGGRRAKGGVVKMASGGLASSKTSKPSGASRGDGIAQRGRTRGKYL